MLRIYFSTFGISSLAGALAAFALNLWIYRETNSVVLVSYAGVAFLFPLLVLSPVSGYFVDRVGVRLSIALSSLGLFASWLLVFAFSFLEVSVWAVILILTVVGVFTSVQGPAYHALIALSVEKSKLTQVNGIFGGIAALVGMFAPFVGAFLLDVAGLSIVCVFPVLAFLLQSIVVFTSKVTVECNTSRSAGESIYSSIIEAARFSLKNGVLLRLLLLGFFVNSFAEAAGSAMTPMGVDLYGEVRAGLVVTIASFGALLGSVLLSLFSITSSKFRWVILLNLFQGIVLICLASFTSMSFVLLGVGVLLFFILEGMYDGIDLSVWQEKAPEHLLATVLSLKATFSVLTMMAGYVMMPLLVESAKKIIAVGDELNILGLMLQFENIIAVALAIVGTANVLAIVLFLLLCGFLKIRSVRRSVVPVGVGSHGA